LLHHTELSINRDYNSISDPNIEFLNKIDKLVQDANNYPCKNDSNGI
jgi:hypothetical protein